VAASLQVRQGCAALIQSVAMQAEIRCYDVEIPPESLIDSQHPDIIHPGYVASPARTSRPLDFASTVLKAASPPQVGPLRTGHNSLPDMLEFQGDAVTNALETWEGRPACSRLRAGQAPWTPAVLSCRALKRIRKPMRGA